MINCVHFRAQWSMRDRLNPTDSMRVRRHLSVCQRCQSYDQQMRAGLSIEIQPGVEQPRS
jgi:hypothetical protein